MAFDRGSEKALAKWVAGLLLLVVALVPVQAARGSPGGQLPRILVLMSYDPRFPTSDDILAGLRDALPPTAYDLWIHFLDTKRLPGPEHAALERSLLAWELRHSAAPDLVMSFDDNALHFVLDNRKALFDGIPVVFAGVNDRDFARTAAASGGVTGVVEAVSIGETVELMLKLFPHAPGISVIVDGTESGRADLRSLQVLDLHIPLAVLDLSALPESDFMASLRRIPRSQAVLLLSAYSGRDGRTYSFEESLALIRQACPAPLFHLWKHGMGQGLFGGKVVSQGEQATRAATLAKRILDGAAPESLPVVWASPNLFLFDWNELRRFDIPPAVLPEGATVINQPPGLMESHPEVFWGMIVAGVALAGLLSALLLVGHYRGKAARRVAQHLDFMERLIQAIETPIYLKNTKAEYLMVNSSFARLAGHDPDWLVGKRGVDIHDPVTAHGLDDLGRRALAGPTPVTEEIDVDLNGERRIFKVTKVALGGPEGSTIILGSMQDLTAERLLAEGLQTDNQRLEAMVAERTIQLERANAVLTAMAETDRLTNLANRRKIDNVLREEHRLAQRYQGFALILLDIDHFKAINDDLGHPTGDLVLQGLANVLRSHCRATDLVGRWGGEEFLIVSRNATLDGALDLAAKLRLAVERSEILAGRPVTASFGVAVLEHGESLPGLLQRVDALLYQAKQNGRNRVEWEPRPQSTSL